MVNLKRSGPMHYLTGVNGLVPIDLRELGAGSNVEGSYLLALGQSCVSFEVPMGQWLAMSKGEISGRQCV